jgi:hypothetical protein
MCEPNCGDVSPPFFWEVAVDGKDDRVSGFKALLESHTTNSYHLIAPDGEFREWQDLSPEGRLEIIAKDAAYYDVPFEPFAQAVREAVDKDAIEEAALRLAMRSTRELHELEGLFPDDGRLEPPPPLVERVSELLNADRDYEDEELLTGGNLTALFSELRADEAAAKREDAHGLEALRKIAEEKTKTASAEKAKDRDIER